MDNIETETAQQPVEDTKNAIVLEDLGYKQGDTILPPLYMHQSNSMDSIRAASLVQSTWHDRVLIQHCYLLVRSRRCSNRRN